MKGILICVVLVSFFFNPATGAATVDSSYIEKYFQLLSYGGIKEKKLALLNLSSLLYDSKYRNNLNLDPILNTLKDDDPALREAAAAFFKNFGRITKGRCADGRIVDSLVEALDDSHPGVRREAAKALGFYHDSRAMDPLIHILKKDDDPWVRLESAYSLGELNARKALPALLDSLRKNNPDWPEIILVQECVIALRKIGYRDAGSIELLMKNMNDPYLKAEIIKTFGKFRSMAAEDVLIQATGDRASVIRKLAVQAIDRLPMIRTGGMDSNKNPKYDLFVRLLKDPSPEVRVTAVEALGRSGDQRAVQPLTDALHDNDRAVQKQAILSLGSFRDESILAGLIPFLDSNSAAPTFISIAQKTADGTVFVYRKDGNRHTAERPVEIPGILKDNKAFYPPNTIEALIQDFPTPAERSREMSAILRKTSEPRPHHEHMLHSTAVDVLIHALKENSGNAKSGALKVIQEFEDDRIEPVLIHLLNDPASEIRYAAMSQLYYFATPKSVPAIIEALDDSSIAVGKKAIQVLGNIGDKRAMQPLLDKLNDDRADVREAALNALRNFDDPRVADANIRMLKDGSSSVRQAALNNINMKPDTRAVESLIALLSDPKAGVMAARTIGLTGDKRGVDPLIQALNGKSGRNRELPVIAARVLSSYEEDRIIPHLIKKVGEMKMDSADPSFLIPAMRVLNRYREDERTEILVRYLKDDDRDIKKGAAFLASMYRDEKASQTSEKMMNDGTGDHAGIESGAAGRLRKSMESGPALVTGLKPLGPAPMLPPSKGLDSEARGLSQKFKSMGPEKNVIQVFNQPSPFENKQKISQYTDLLKQGNAAERKAALAAIPDFFEVSEYRKDPALIVPVLDALVDQDPSIREAAAASLHKIGEKTRVLTDGKIVSALVMALMDEDREVRRQAAKALAYYKNEQALEPLMQRLHDKDPGVRHSAAGTLGRLDAEKAAFALLDLFNDNTDWPQKSIVRKECLVALAGIGRYPANSLPLLIENYNDDILRPEIVKALGRAYPPDAPEIRDLLTKASKDPDGEVRNRAIEAMTKLPPSRAGGVPIEGSPDIDLYIKSLDDPSPRVRTASVAALAKTGNAGVVEPLMKALHDDDEDVRQAAVTALGKFKDDRILGELAPFLVSGSERLSMNALNSFHNVARNTGKREVYAYRKNGTRHIAANREEIPGGAAAKKHVVHPVAIDVLIDALHTADPEGKVRVLRQIGEFEDDRIEPLLIKQMDDPSPLVRRLALDLLKDFNASGVIPPVVGALGDPDPEVRKKAAWVLGWLKNKEAVAPLLKSLNDDNADVKHSVMLALGTIKDERAIEPLIEQLRDPNAEIRRGALNALLYFDDPSVVTQSIKMLQDDSADVRGAAVWNIKNKPEKRAVEPLILLLNDPDIGARAADALGDIGDIRAVEPLIKALEGGYRGSEPEIDTMFKLSAASALGRIGGEKAVNALINMAQSNAGDTYLQIMAVKSLGKTKDKTATMPLVRILSDTRSDIWLRAEAASALGEIGDERAIDPLRESTRDLSDALRNAAEEALIKMGKTVP